MNTLLPLYSEACLTVLRQALEREQKAGQAIASRRRPENDAASSDSDKEEEDESSGSSGEEEVNDEAVSSSQSSVSASPTSNDNNKESSSKTTTTTTTTTSKQPKPIKQAKQPKPSQSEKERLFAIKKHTDNLICDVLPIHDNEAVHVSTSLLSKDNSSSMSIADRNYVAQSPCQEYVALSESLQQQQTQQPKRNILVLLLRSGRFAAGIFQGPNCIIHRACQRYTVRKGQGKAQSAQDGSRRPKSAGAQLRRAGEENLQQDMKDTLLDWKTHINNNKTCLILISCPKSMKKYLFDAIDASVFTKDDPRLRRLPLDVGRPSFESVCLAYQVMMTAQICPWSATAAAAAATSIDDDDNDEKSASNSTTTTTTNKKKSKAATIVPPPIAAKKETDVVFPMTPLHEACQQGNVAAITELLLDLQQSAIIPESADGAIPEECLTVEQMINRRVGPEFWTCLHFAAAAAAAGSDVGSGSGASGESIPPAVPPSVVDPETAAACVTLLLVEGRADPGIIDARSRPPMFVATHHKIRDAFGMARATLGEEHCAAWDDAAKVGPALTVDDIQAKKDREAEKRRKKKARQKQKKAEEKAETEQDHRQRDEAEQVRKQEEDAKRVRDGLKPKGEAGGGTLCDFCQTVVKGRKRKDMYSRLEYVYCSAECVQKHKRELMAAAAMARFGG